MPLYGDRMLSRRAVCSADRDARCARRTADSAQHAAARRGLTIIEILVSATLALVIIVAMVRLFATVGGGVSTARATVEMSSQLRMATNRLRRDLDGLTLPVRPWVSPADGLGYFEWIEGPTAYISSSGGLQSQPFPSVDRDADGSGGTPDPLVDANSANGPDYLEFQWNLSIGDIDDILMFTAKSVQEPFVGKVRAAAIFANASGGFRIFQQQTNPSATALPLPFDNNSGSPQTIESPIAEIVWWTRSRFIDTSGNNIWEHGEEIFTTLYRRVLLVRPELNTGLDLGEDGGPFDPMVDEIGMAFIKGPDANALAPLLKSFLNQNDVSVRMVRKQVGGQECIVFVANSLGDLTIRENRFAHAPIIREPTLNAGSFVFVTPYPPAIIAPVDRDPRSITSLPRVVKSGDQVIGWNSVNESTTELGEDVILSNVVGFDVRGFDPQAVVQRPDISSNPSLPDIALVPGDTQYGTGTIPTTAIGLGAFVDLNYDNGILATPTALSGVPNAKSGLAFVPTYDTWSTHYENDGLDQDLDGSNLGESMSPTDPNSGYKVADGIDNNMNGLTDEYIDGGTNGIDDDGVNGVDDPFERDTSPPYPVSLRGIKVSLRVMEIDTKQVRQAIVVSDFIPE